MCSKCGCELQKTEMVSLGICAFTITDDILVQQIVHRLNEEWNLNLCSQCFKEFYQTLVEGLG